MEGYVATIGMFDGVHRGHQFVLRHVVETARECSLQSMAITFDTFGTFGKPQLTPLADKVRLLAATGIDRVEVLPFTDQLRHLTARQFMQQVLQQRLAVRVLLIGYDNRFGYRREEGFADYVRYGRELGIDVRQLPADGRVSSSLVRQLLSDGRVSDVTAALGRPYAVVGRVAHGEHVGTTLGFPTANVEPLSAQQLVPASGAYAVLVRLEGSARMLHGMMNIGHRPTFDGRRQTLEVNIFRLDRDLYGQQLEVLFIGRLRDERCFEGADALKAQLAADARHAEQLLNTYQTSL